MTPWAGSSLTLLILSFKTAGISNSSPANQPQFSRKVVTRKADSVYDGSWATWGLFYLIIPNRVPECVPRTQKYLKKKDF